MRSLLRFKAKRQGSRDFFSSEDVTVSSCSGSLTRPFWKLACLYQRCNLSRVYMISRLDFLNNQATTNICEYDEFGEGAPLAVAKNCAIQGTVIYSEHRLIIALVIVIKVNWCKRIIMDKGSHVCQLFLYGSHIFVHL